MPVAGVTFNTDRKFDLQLAQALIAERRLAEIFVGAKIERVELKTETYQWRRTGNIAIEYANAGRPSGIATTEADWWFHEVCADDGTTLAYFMWPVDRLKQLCRDAWHQPGRRFVGGGDDGKSSGVLLRVADILQLPR